MSTTAQDTRALATGRWKIDAAHSEVSFVARHLMVSKVRGGFTRAAFSATAQLDRRDFGVGPSSRLDGGVALGDRADIELEVQAVRTEVAS